MTLLPVGRESDVKLTRSLYDTVVLGCYTHVLGVEVWVVSSRGVAKCPCGRQRSETGVPARGQQRAANWSTPQ